MIFPPHFRLCHQNDFAADRFKGHVVCKTPGAACRGKWDRLFRHDLSAGERYQVRGRTDLKSPIKWR